MKNEIFREKSLEKLSSPEELNEYLHVTNPAIWTVLASIILLLAGLLVWSNFTSIESRIPATAVAEKGVLTITVDDEENAKKINAGMQVSAEGIHTKILSVSTGKNGQLTALASANLPDGVYDATISYQSTRILHLLFN